MAGNLLSTTSGSKRKYQQDDVSDEDSEADLVIDCDDEEEPERGKLATLSAKVSKTDTSFKGAGSRRNSLDEKYDAVERALEEMFADSPVQLDKPIASTSSAASTESVAVAPPKKRGRKPNSEKKITTLNQKPLTKKKLAKKSDPRKFEIVVPPELQNGKKASKKLKLQEPSRDPFIRVEGDSKHPSWVGVVNSVSDPLSRSQEIEKSKQEVGQKVLAAGYGFHSTSVRPKYQSNIFSTKYDTFNEDASWNCVFCKNPSHFQGLGDLFGPFFLDLIPVPEKSTIKHKHKSKANESKNFPSSVSPQKVRHSSHTNGDVGKSEVWFHGDCLSWMRGIKLVGHLVLGLENAVKASMQETCFQCHKKGCTIACQEARCFLTSHFICAKNSGWHLDEQKLRAYCTHHSSI